MDVKITEPGSFDPEEIAALREDYLRTLASLANSSAKIELYDGTNLTGTFKSWDPDTGKFLFTNTKIPMSKDPCAVLLRQGDMISVTFSEKKKE